MRFFVILSTVFCVLNASVVPKISDILAPKSVIEERDISKLEDPFFGQKATSKPRKSFFLEPQKPSLRLEAIFEKSAMINGKWVKEGESIEGYRLIGTDKNKATLNGYGEQIILNLFFIKGDNEAR